MGEWRYSPTHSALYGSVWSVHTPDRSTPKVRADFVRDWVGPRASLDAVAKGKILIIAPAGK